MMMVASVALKVPAENIETIVPTAAAFERTAVASTTEASPGNPQSCMTGAKICPISNKAPL